MKLNKEWHLKHKMPENATIDEKIAWHLEHQKNCQCRDMPDNIKLAIKQRKDKHLQNRS
jgi:hypothetical protein